MDKSTEKPWPINKLERSQWVRATVTGPPITSSEARIFFGKSQKVLKYAECFPKNHISTPWSALRWDDFHCGLFRKLLTKQTLESEIRVKILQK